MDASSDGSEFLVDACNVEGSFDFLALDDIAFFVFVFFFFLFDFFVVVCVAFGGAFLGGFLVALIVAGTC